MTMAAPVALVDLVGLSRAPGGARPGRGDAVDSWRLMAPGACRTRRGRSCLSSSLPPRARRACSLAATRPFSWRDLHRGAQRSDRLDGGLDLLRAGSRRSLPWRRLGAADRPAAPTWLGGRARLYAMLILGVPLGVALGPSGQSRLRALLSVQRDRAAAARCGMDRRGLSNGGGSIARCRATASRRYFCHRALARSRADPTPARPARRRGPP